MYSLHAAWVVSVTNISSRRGLRIEGRVLPQWDLLHHAVKLTGTGLVDHGFCREPLNPHRHMAVGPLRAAPAVG